MARLLVFALVASVCAAYVSRFIELRTPITEFLPGDAQQSALELARELADAPQARVVVFSLGARGGSGAHREAARELARRLERSGLFEWVRGGVSESDERDFYDLVFPARLGLVPLPLGQQGPVADAFLRQRVGSLRERLGGPLGMLERRLSPEDPLGAFSSLLEAQIDARGQLTLEDRQLVTNDGAFSVIFAATKARAFDAEAQREVERTVQQAFAALNRDGALQLEWAGLNRYGLEGERSVRGDIERISSLSLLGIFVLYLFVFRSLREPLLVLLPLGFGGLLATALCQLVFGYVHGLALGFGSAVIGVAEDYSTHYFAHRLATPASEDNESLMRRLFPGMLLGAITTVAGICCLFASGFRGLAQMALFGVVGVLGALACTRFVLPTLSRKQPLPEKTRMSRLGVSMLDGLVAKPWRAAFLIAPSLLAIALGAPRLHFEDSLRALRTRAPELDAENQRVQARIGRSEAGQVVVALGETDEQALQRSEQVLQRLSQAARRGEVRAVKSVSTLLPSLETQRARRARMTSDPTFLPRLTAVLKEEGFVPEAFAPFEAHLQAAKREPAAELTPASVQGSPLSSTWLTPFRARLGGQVAYLTSLESRPGVDVAALVRDIPGVTYLDQEALYSAAYKAFRTRTSWLLGLGMVLVTAILLARYRSVKMVALAMVPPLLGAGAALGVEVLRGVPANLMHVIGVLLVLSMGVDFAIYLLESRSSVEEGVTTLGSVLLATATTILSFGLLGLSQNPALAAVGATVGFGLCFTVLASPVVLAFIRPERT